MLVLVWSKEQKEEGAGRERREKEGKEGEDEKGFLYHVWWERNSKK